MTLTTDEKGQIRAKGFIPGKMIVKEIDAPKWVQFNPQETKIIDFKANNADEIHDIENTIVKTSVQVTKVWEDKNDKGEKRPESVTVKLLADGTETTKILTLTKANNWTGSFTDLDEYKDGKKIEYTVKEVGESGNAIKLDGKWFKVTYTGDMKDGFKVTNKEEKPDEPKPNEPEKPNKPNKPEKPTPNTPKEPSKNLPKTGDGFNPSVYATVMALVGGALTLLGIKRRKEDEDK